MKSVYITRSNCKKLPSFFELDDSVSKDDVFLCIYEKDLRDFLNELEAQTLYKLKMILNQDEKRLKVKKENESQQYFSAKYVFSVGSKPKYHLYKDCKYLNQDFDNYLIPVEIKEKGQDAIRQFQQYCVDHIKLFREEPEKFWKRVAVYFRIKNLPKHISYRNSEYNEVSSASIDNIRDNINTIYNKLHDMLYAKNFTRYQKDIKRYRYKNANQLSELDKIQELKNDRELMSIIKNFFELKKDITNLLFTLYVKETNMDDYCLPIELLENFGFSLCKECENRQA